MNSLNKLIWSKGPYINNYAYKSSPCNENEIIEIIENSKDIIWIRNGVKGITKDLDYFSNNLNKIKNPIILITSDGDRHVPSSYSEDVVNIILESKKVITWYTQNYDMTIIHEKLKHYPIGFDLHTRNWFINNSVNQKINFMVKCRNESPTDNRISDKIFSETHHSISHPDRQKLYNTLQNNETIIFTNTRLFFDKITKEYNKYNFVLSPRGMGYDCHRTWELFLAGVIVITKTSPLDKMFTENDLPVVIINEWDELNHDLENKLKKWYNQYIHLTSTENIFPKLLFNYWIKSFNPSSS